MEFIFILVPINAEKCIQKSWYDDFYGILHLAIKVFMWKTTIYSLMQTREISSDAYNKIYCSGRILHFMDPLDETKMETFLFTITDIRWKWLMDPMNQAVKIGIERQFLLEKIKIVFVCIQFYSPSWDPCGPEQCCRTLCTRWWWGSTSCWRRWWGPAPCNSRMIKILRETWENKTKYLGSVYPIKYEL